MEWSDILLIFIGALVSFLGAILYKVVENCFSRRGAIDFYTRQGRMEQNMFYVPLEIVNRTSSDFMIRDIMFVQINTEREVVKEYQCCTQVEKVRGDAVIEKQLFAQEGNYSFLVESKSIKPLTLCFMYEIPVYLPEDDFPKFALTFCDERGSKKILPISYEFSAEKIILDKDKDYRTWTKLVSYKRRK